MTATTPGTTGDVSTTTKPSPSSADTRQQTVPGVFGPIPVDMVPDADRAHPLTASAHKSK